MSNINVNNLTPLLGSGSSVSVSGSLVVKNDVTIGGHLYIGDANTDSVTFSAEVSSSILPDATVTYDLGSSAKRWRTMYLNSLVIHHITASGNISASGTGTNGTGSFHHLYSNGNVHATGTGSFDQGVIANQSSSFTYVSMSGALKTAYHVTASRLQIIKTAEIYGSASMGYISSSGDLTASGTGSFGGGIDSSTATGSFGQVTVEGDVSSSATGSFMDVFIDDNLEVQGVTNLHGNISSSNSVTASFGYLSSSGDLNVTGNISSSRVSASNGFEADLTSTSSFGHVTMSGDLGVGTTTSPLGHVHIKDGNSNGETPSLNANDLIIEGNGNTGLTIMTNTTSQGAIYFGDDSKNDGRIIYQHGVAPRMSIYTQAHEFRLSGSGASFSGDVSSSGRVSASSGFEADGGTTSNFGNISMSGALTLTGDVSASRVSASAGFEADSDSKSTFGHISMSGDLQIGNNTVVVSGSVGQITASGNISGGAQVFGGDYYAQGLQFATQADNQSSGVLQIGGSQPMRIKGTSVMLTGSVSMSGTLSASGANADISTDQGNIFSNSGTIFTNAGAISSSEHLIGNLIQQHTAGVTNFAVDALGQVTASGQISSSAGLAGTALTLATTGTTYASIDALGTGSFLGGIDCIGDAKNATGSFGYVSASGDISSSGTVFGETLIVGAGNSIINGNVKFNGGIVRPLKTITADTVLDATSGVFADAGKTIVLNAAAGASVVLPAAQGTGNVYNFFVGTAITSNSYIIKVADATDTFIGAVHMMDADDDSQTSITAKGTDDTLTMNGGTTGGGLLGDTLTFTDIATNKYVVQGNIIVPAGSNPGDPFSATVS